MKLFRNIPASFAIVFIIALTASAQRGNDGPVIVFDQQNGGGGSQSFGVGEYRNDRSQLGALRNDSAASVYVSDNYRVRFCDSENRNGSGRCEEFGPGYNNLRYAGTASYIRVTGPNAGWNSGGGWNGGSNGNVGNNGIGQRGVTVYDDRDFRGASQSYGPGRYLNSAGGLGSIRNDEASSVVVERGFSVRLCESEGGGGGDGKCDEYNEGRFNLQLNDEASYIEVRRTGGLGGNNGWGNNNGGWGNNNGGWGNNNGGWGNNNGGWNGNNGNNFGGVVIVYSEQNQRGTQQAFDVGVFGNDQRSLGNIRNDDASSIVVPRGYRVRLCESEGGGAGTGRCEEYGEGRRNLRYNDKMSFIQVWRSR